MTTTLLSIFLFVSLSINFLFFWYVRNLLRYLKVANQETGEVLMKISNYSEHLTQVYNRDVFYGDPTLESLLLHTKDLAEEIDAFVEISNEIMTEANDA